MIGAGLFILGFQKILAAIRNCGASPPPAAMS
jgi:hypothetical protein